jgi:hypothetical protein
MSQSGWRWEQEGATPSRPPSSRVPVDGGCIVRLHLERQLDVANTTMMPAPTDTACRWCGGKGRWTQWANETKPCGFCHGTGTAECSICRVSVIEHEGADHAFGWRWTWTVRDEPPPGGAA